VNVDRAHELIASARVLSFPGREDGKTGTQMTQVLAEQLLISENQRQICVIRVLFFA
jgi:hypothetical protein